MPPKHVTVYCLTVKANGGRLRELKTDCGVCAAFDPANVADAERPTLTKFQAIWDTGATNSVITQPVVDACGLKPIGVVQVAGVAGLSMTEQYLVNIMLPNGIGFPNVPVTRGDFPGSQVLIGMDLITRGDFAITNEKGITTFSFRYPSLATIDYAKEHNPNPQKQNQIVRQGFQHGSKFGKAGS